MTVFADYLLLFEKFGRGADVACFPRYFATGANKKDFSAIGDSTSYSSVMVRSEKVVEITKERQENGTPPGSENPFCSVFPVSLNPQRLVGSESPCHAGGLVGRHPPAFF